MAEKLLDIDGLKVSFRTEDGVVRAVDGISIGVTKGVVLGIVGESGSGKSVTMMSVMRLIIDPNVRFEGTVLYKGRDLMELSQDDMREVRGKEIAMIFQDPMTSLNPVLTVGAQLREAIEEHLDLDRKAATRRAVELLEQVGIPSPADRLRNYPHQFSGGMRQRVMIAIALACEPKVLIAEEPTTALDVTIQAQILDLLRDLVADRGTSLVLITHDLGVVAGMCERVKVMYAGTLIEEGSASELFAAPRHPYTLGLLQSVPRLDAGRKQPLRPIPGAPRNMLSEPVSCPFAPRCRNRIDRCDTELPQLERLDTGQRAACFNPAAADEWQRSRLGGEAA